MKSLAVQLVFSFFGYFWLVAVVDGCSSLLCHTKCVLSHDRFGLFLTIHDP